MRVTHLSLSDFRNYRSAEVSLDRGPNLVIGRNGQGKTNLAEAIAYFAMLGSHRVTSDSALIRAGEDSAVARMRVAVDDRDVLLEMQLNRDRANRAQINRNAAKPRELTRWFSCVVFAPEDLSLVRGDPGIRRRFLDEAVVARQPSFAGVIADYERVVRQRTALLKSARGSANRTAIDATLEIWDEQLADLGTRIMLARRALVRSLAEPLRSGYAAIVQHDHEPRVSLMESVESALEKQGVSRETSHVESEASQTVGSRGEGDSRPVRESGEGDVSRETSAVLSNAPGAEDAEHLARVSRETLLSRFRAAIASVRRQEFERGVTLVGPHRDDALFELNGLPVKGYASHGESWSFALALRLAFASLLREESPSGDPVIILDDVFAELDVRRRNALMSEVARFEQVIVTAAVEEDVPAGEWNRVLIEAGRVVEGGGAHAEG